jgi:hypothetical protein
MFNNTRQGRGSLLYVTVDFDFFSGLFEFVVKII